MIKLYSNHCPKCGIIKAKLDAKNIEYELVDDMQTLIQLELDQMPVLEVEGQKLVSMLDINNYINTL